MSIIGDDLRGRLLDGLPPLVQGMAEGIILEWDEAVHAVPELERLAAEDVGRLAAMPATTRELVLRKRWTRLHEVPAFELRGLPVRAPSTAGVGRTAAAH